MSKSIRAALLLLCLSVSLALGQDNRDLINEINDLRNENLTLRSEIGSMKIDYATLQGRVATLESNYSKLEDMPRQMAIAIEKLTRLDQQSSSVASFFRDQSGNILTLCLLGGLFAYVRGQSQGKGK